MRQSPYINLTCRSLLNTLSLCFCCLWCSAQKERTVIAGPQYNRPQFHQWLWGQHYRKEWTTPVRIQQLNLDTSFGGLKPNQAAASIPNTLQLRDASGQPYVLRKVNKGFDRTIPDIYKGTFIENLTNDQVSMGHPYGAVTIPRLAAAAGIYHTQPIIRFVPRQPALDSFNTSFGDQLHLLEQQPAGNWENAANFGHAKNIISTEDLFNALLNDNSNLVDQHMYVRARLFDMFIGDWSRHEEQWTWATVENNGKTYYQAIP
ncbi:MAG TPA: hypothetical protein VD996_14495, partial [Chitinophagaceae bacterium]|nr:hypothetical protein [Chitinophagaceae bacterium]